MYSPYTNVSVKQSHEYRKLHSNRFISLGNGKFGGFKPGVLNGPEGTTKRCIRRNKSKSN